MKMKKNSNPWPSQEYFTFENRLGQAAITQFRPGFTQAILAKMTQTSQGAASIWNGLILFSRPMLLASTLLILLLLTLNIFFSNPGNAEIYELSDLNFEILVADSVR